MGGDEIYYSIIIASVLITIDAGAAAIMWLTGTGVGIASALVAGSTVHIFS